MGQRAMANFFPDRDIGAGRKPRFPGRKIKQIGVCTDWHDLIRGIMEIPLTAELEERILEVLDDYGQAQRAGPDL